MVTQMLWRQVEALLNVHRRRYEEAERFAHEAVCIADSTDGLNLQGETREDRAHVLFASGQIKEATAVLNEAFVRYEHKRNIPAARRVRERLSALRFGS